MDCEEKKRRTISAALSSETYVLEYLSSHFELTKLSIVMKKLARLLKAFLFFPSGFKLTCISKSRYLI